MSKILTGGRAELSIDGAIVGIFESCTYGANLGTEPAFILGRFGAAEITLTSYEVINVNCSGFRIINSGAHTLPKFPKLDDLLNLPAVTLSIRDRQTNSIIMTVTGCVPTSYNTGVNARATSRLQISYQGLKLIDESGDQAEDKPTDLP